MNEKKCRPFLKGLGRMLFSIAIAAIYVASLYEFFKVTNDSGYVAVVDFLLGSFAFAVAVGCTYLLGVLGNE